MARFWLLAFVGLAVAGAVAGCDKSKSATSHSPTATTPPAQPVVAAKPPVDAAPKTVRRPSAAGRPAGDPSSWGAYCGGPSGCVWDDSCVPTACIAAAKRPARADVKCAESKPPPGSCECIEQRCTVRPKTTSKSASAGTCTGDYECAVDPATARCYATANPSKSRLQRPLRVEGPMCRCDAKSKHCQLHWSAKISCKTFRDCGWATDPVLRPTKAAKPRKRKRRPCVDGSFDSVCVPDSAGSGKHCAIVAWRC